MYFHYSQNNSGGSFDFDEKAGITHHVVVYGKDAKEANRKAEDIGLYWDGCYNDMDCSCCGDRWYPCDDSEGTKTPTVYGESVSKHTNISAWMKEGKEIAVHYKNGKIKWFGVKLNNNK
jgi:hypothetical protein